MYICKHDSHYSHRQKKMYHNPNHNNNRGQENDHEKFLSLVIYL